MLENRHFLIGIFQHFTTVADNRTQKQLKAFSEQNPAIKQPEHNAAKTLKR